MNLLAVFNDENVAAAEIQAYPVRQAVRAIVQNDRGQIAILHSAKYNYYLLPGGGVEFSELLESAVMRECLEETGCEVEIVKELGQIDEVRQEMKRINRSFCYVVKVVRNINKVNLESDEAEAGLDVQWLEMNEVLKLMEADLETGELYQRYVKQRDFLFLQQVA